MTEGHEPLCLAIDLGTGGLKVGVVSLEGRLVAQELHAVSTHYGQGGAATQDAGAWWRTISDASRRILSREDVEAHDVAAVAVTGQWSSTVPVDANGVPTGACVMWMDSRGGPYTRRLIGGKVQGYRPAAITKWITKTGGAPSTSGDDPIGHLLYLLHDEPELVARTSWFLEPVDYLTMRFSGVAAACHASMQGAWLTDNRRLDVLEYDADLVGPLGIPTDKLPPLHEIGSVVGHVQAVVADALGLRGGVAVVTGLPDLQAAAVGAGAVAPYATHLALSTTSWISCPVPKKHTDSFHSIATVPGLTNDSYLLVNNQETGAKALEWLRGILAGGGVALDYDELSQLALTADPGAGGVLFTPWLAGERSPVDDRSARGGFTNLSLSTTTADMVRSVFEGVAYNSRWLLGYVEKFAKQRLDPIRLVGGGARSALWCQVYADVLNRRVEQVQDPMFAQLRGMAAVAGVALGHRRLEETVSVLPPTRAFEPDASRAARYDELAEEIPELYAEGKKRWRRLNRAR
ncbi:MAG TPA: FGGY-family carbohydrate kinase [Acidimicrobiales bacterium]|jgi:xylulokinase|nr:FGGY-family carbohydrate kinase [Acidimicrobiales bacterium]